MKSLHLTEEETREVVRAAIHCSCGAKMAGSMPLRSWLAIMVLWGETHKGDNHESTTPRACARTRREQEAKQL